MQTHCFVRGEAPCLGVQACLRRVNDLKQNCPWRKPVCSGVLSCLRRVKDLNKRDVPGVNHWAPPCYLASGGAKISTKHLEGKHCIYILCRGLQWTRLQWIARIASAEPPPLASRQVSRQASPAVQQRGSRGPFVPGPTGQAAGCGASHQLPTVPGLPGASGPVTSYNWVGSYS